MNTCANPKCFRFPMRGSSLCGACDTRKDAMLLVAILVTALVVFAGIVKAFGIVRAIR